MKTFYKILLRLTLPILWMLAAYCLVWTLVGLLIPGLFAAFICFVITGKPHWDKTIVWTILPAGLLCYYMDWLKKKDVINF